ncbi:MAG: hypothetical protein OSA38_05565 [Candidatus Poseidoniaceae archaeon]|nr:hypothetical protein [Candidatus Poseidoniaceae archaeon]
MTEQHRWSNIRQQTLAHLLIGLMCLSIFVPMAAAAGMTSCNTPVVDGICDTYVDSHDGTPDYKDWIEGTYDFTMLGTEQLQLELTWAIREFDRAALGLDSPLLAGMLANDGLEAKDGAPADLIRNYMDQESAGAGSPTIGEKLQNEIAAAIAESLQSSFGEVSVSTGYVNQYVESGVTTTCSTDPTTDSEEEGASENNAFNPPICLSTSALIQLDQSTFNLAENDDLNLERAYQGLMVMGTEITSSFDFVARRGHLATYTVNPPSYSTIASVDSAGQIVEKFDTSAFNSGSWVIDHRTANEVDSDLTQGVELTLVHRNRSDTKTVNVPEGSKAMDIHITLDLRDESAATLGFTAGMHYLDAATLDDWGVSLMDAAEKATVPIVTADGIRLAYHNGLVDLSNFTSQFPVDVIAEGVSSTVAGIDTIEMSEMRWISTTPAIGSRPAGGLNYSHSAGCSEVVAGGVDLNYCIRGEAAMGITNPVYLETSSQPFSMRLIDILSQNNNIDEIGKVIDELTTADFERVLNSGLTLETVLNSSYLSAIVPANLPPSEVTLEIVLPNWVRTANGSDRLVLKDTLGGNDVNSISFAGTNPYDWRHAIRGDNQNVICPSTNKTCVTSAIEMDALSFDINEWDFSLGFEFALDADVSVYRIGIPSQFLDDIDTGEHSVTMQALPSDLIRLGLDIASRVDQPLNRTIDLGEIFGAFCPGFSICNESLTFEFTSEGLMAFVKRVGELFTQFIQDAAKELVKTDIINFKEIDISDFEVKTRLKGVGAPDLIVSDEEPLSLTLKIPKVKFSLKIDPDFEKIREGNTSGVQISLVTDLIRSTFIEPMGLMMQGITGMLTNSIIGLGGLTLPNGEDNPDDVLTVPFKFSSTLNEDFELAVNGPIKIILPSGITLENLESSQGNIQSEVIDGRQEITYIMPAGDVDDKITFQIHLSWVYFLVQFWKYPAIIVILLMLFVRRRRKKRAKRNLRRARFAASAKPKIGNDEFADLSGFHSEAIHGEFDEFKELNKPSAPPLPAGISPFKAPPTIFEESMIEEVPLPTELIEDIIPDIMPDIEEDIMPDIEEDIVEEVGEERFD